MAASISNKAEVGADTLAPADSHQRRGRDKIAGDRGMDSFDECLSDAAWRRPLRETGSRAVAEALGEFDERRGFSPPPGFNDPRASPFVAA